MDVSDLLILLGQWGACSGTFLCGGDLSGDTVVDVSDLLILLGAWGSCPATVCDTGFTCGDVLEDCPGTDGDCFCWTGFSGNVVCAGDGFCDELQPCPDGNCPIGFVCVSDSCCGEPICLPECSAALFIDDLESGKATASRPAMTK